MSSRPPAPSDVPLYSETPTDDRGNFSYIGDLYRPGEPFASICARLGVHIAAQFPDLHCAITRSIFASGRKISVEIQDTSRNLRDDSNRDRFIVLVRDQIERFGFVHSNFMQDYMSVCFYCDVAVGPAYWAALAARTGLQNPVQPLMSLAQFKRTIKAGDTLCLLHASWTGRNIGVERTVEAVRSKDIIIAGSYLTLPRASAFACDGDKVRIATGDGTNPDAHLLYRWTRQGAGEGKAAG
ncbi:MAG: hypothetical protein C0494_05855 [Sphingobium sp.]|nr:hypothetical protein [Sphingobium sp.]